MYLRLMIVALVVVCAVTTVNAIKCYVGEGDEMKEKECKIGSDAISDELKRTWMKSSVV